MSLTASYPAFMSLSGSTFTISPALSISGTFLVTVNLNDNITPAVVTTFNVVVVPD